MTQGTLERPEFVAFPKVPRLNRDMIITEKLDGTNAAIGICVATTTELKEEVAVVELEGTRYYVWAQSRKRQIFPGKSSDNSGFAAWVWENADELVATLGTGRHYGEWWGKGIQRGYALEEKRFSLFAVDRYLADAEDNIHTHQPGFLGGVPGLDVVPVLKRWTFDTSVARGTCAVLGAEGSVAAPGFDRPEGIMVYHTAANQVFKMTCDNDDKPKGAPNA